MNRTDVFYTVWEILSNATSSNSSKDDEIEAIAAAIVYAALEFSDKSYNIEEVLPEVWVDIFEPGREVL